MRKVKEMQNKESIVLETTKQDSETSDQKWSWVEATIWTDRMLAALGNGVQGGKWYSLIDKVYRPTTLKAAWAKVRANRGTAGIDGQSVSKFERHAARYLDELRGALIEGSYRPASVKRVEIPKGQGQMRPLGIPTVKDRIVQAAVKMVVEPIFEATFVEHSYGFRPQRGAKDALREVNRLIKEGYHYVVDADLKCYFDTIPHEGLCARLQERISDKQVLALMDGWLKQKVVTETENWTPVRGSPQGAVISPLLANLYLHPLDLQMKESRYCMVRYADDFVVMCKTEQEAQAALEDICKWVEANGLTLHPGKTHIGDCRIEGQGFDFLGYRFEAGEKRIRKKSWTKLTDRIREKTRRCRGDSIVMIINDLNPMLRGWFNYFKHAKLQTLTRVDGMVRRRLRAILRKQQKRPGRGITLADHKTWPNTYFAALGLFTLKEAHGLASRSR